jgi:2-amino-4-hydroxy-6-hydroxymethyldihydropteridine diphosphokinase
VSALAATVAAVGIGSNLDDPVAQVRRALAALARLPDTELLASSSLYRNPPMGPQDQPDYVNAAALLRTQLDPFAFLDALQAVERGQGRVRGDVQWGPRTIDLDLLLWGEQVIDEARLKVPHPGLHERVFVLYPLAEIAPGLPVPGRGSVGDLAAGLASASLVKLSPAE